MAQLKDTSVTGTLSTTGKATLASAGVTGNATVGGTLKSTGKVTASGALQVDGNFYVKGSVADSTFTVNAPATFNKVASFTNQIEIHSTGTSSTTKTPYIDFHYSGATTDYSARIICPAEGMLDLIGSGQYSTLRMDTNTGYFYPTVSNAFSIGKTDRRIHSIFLSNSPNVSSLVELKEDIKPFTSALEEIDKTDVYNYKLKSCIERNGSDSDHTGFIIGEGYNISELLLAHEKDGIDLYNAIGVTFGGVKELYELVKTQQNKIDEQQSKIDVLESRLNTLEEKLNK